MGQPDPWQGQPDFKQQVAGWTTWFFLELLRPDAFVRRDRCLKQVPLAFAIMSRRTTPDYAAVLRAVVNALPSPPVVKAITTDFETAIWNGCRRVFPGVTVLGCGFHWTPAVERQFGEHGLIAAYKDKSGPLRDLLRTLVALPYLPAEEIPTAFNRLEDIAIGHGDEPLVNLFEYVGSTWLESGVWSIVSWSVYKRMVRTNNDTECWHWRLNSRTSDNVPLYLLIATLHEEATLVKAQVQLVQEQRLPPVSEECLHDTASKDAGSLARIPGRPFERRAAVASHQPLEPFMNIPVILCTGYMIGDSDMWWHWLWALTIGIYLMIMMMMYWRYQTCTGPMGHYLIWWYLYDIWCWHELYLFDIICIWQIVSVWHLFCVYVWIHVCECIHECTWMTIE